MSDNSQMIEQIFSNVDKIGETMESTIDLSGDVAPFMSATLAKIKHLALLKDASFEAQHELFQIATNYLPRAFNAYCFLPIEYRNTRTIKAEKTARQLLIEDLNIFKKQVNELEKQMYAGVESQIKVNSNVVRDKYDSKFQLATELERISDDDFVNQFEFSSYKESLDYKNIKFKKELDIAQIKSKERKESFKKSVNKAIEFTSALGKLSHEKIAPIFCAEVVIPVCIISAFCAFFFFVISLLVNIENSAHLSKDVINTSKAIHQLMDVAMIPNTEFKSVTDSKKKELIGNSNYFAERISINSDTVKRITIIQVSDIDQKDCMKMIDAKENSFDLSLMKVNGIELPADKVTSDYYALENENHKLCHLKKGNRISIEFNNQKIHDKPQFSLEEKNLRLMKMKEEAASYKAEALKTSGSQDFNSLTDMEKSVNIAIEKLSAELK